MTATNVRTVLIVDDSEFDRLLLSKVLEARGFHVECAVDALSGLAMIAADPPISF